MGGDYERKILSAFAGETGTDDFFEMLAICGSGEVNDMKTSLTLLGSNPHCRTMVLSKAGHDFPMRKAEKLNPILREFISGVKADEKKSQTAE